MAVQTLIQVRRDTAANWTATDPTLSAGEFGYEADTGKVKIGDGSTAWTALGYIGDDGIVAKVDNLITLTGVAANATNLGVQGSGTIITDNVDINTALGELDAAVTALTANATTYVAATIAARDALTVQTGDIVLVVDASADGTVTSGSATYVWDGAAFIKISEAESIDVTLTAADVANVAAGNIAATDVQAAINELDTEKQADVITTRGDYVRGSAAGVAERAALGANGTFLKSDGTDLIMSNIIDGGSA